MIHCDKPGLIITGQGNIYNIDYVQFIKSAATFVSH